MRRNMKMTKLLIFVDFNFLVKPCFSFHNAEFKLLRSIKHFLHAKIKLWKRTKSHELAYDLSYKKQSHWVWAFWITDEAIVRRISTFWCPSSGDFSWLRVYLYCNNHLSSSFSQRADLKFKFRVQEIITKILRKNLLTTDAWIWLMQEKRMKQATKAGESP